MALGEAYKPAFGGTPVLILPSTVQPTVLLSGDGSPEGVVPGVPGQAWHDLLTDDLYLKLGGVQEKGWRLVGKVPS